MTRKRNQSKFRDELQYPPQLRHEETGNFAEYHPDGRVSIREVRDHERELAARYADPRVMLPNPYQSAPFDRTEPQGRIAKNEAFGFQVQPNLLIDLPPGDAGAGESMFRRGQFYARLDNPNNEIVAGNPFDREISMATYVSSDNRSRFWRVSFFGIAAQRSPGRVGTLPPMSGNEILSEQLKPVVNGASSTVPFIPAITQLQGRIMVNDESGSRFYDFDIMGTRSVDLYAWGVTASILGPGNFGTDQGFYQVNRNSGGTDVPQVEFGGLVENAIIGVRIIPIVIASLGEPENRTITALTNATDPTRVPIPPGTRKLQIINHDSAAAAALFDITFDSGNDGAFPGNSTQGVININAGETKSDVVLVPNCVQVIFTPQLLAAATAWSLIFSVDP
jgi:hypothetical protein